MPHLFTILLLVNYTVYIHNLYEVCTYLSKYLLRLVCWYYHLKTFLQRGKLKIGATKSYSVLCIVSAAINQGRKLFKGGNYWFLGGFDRGNYSREETIQGRKLLIFRRFWPRKLFKGGKYSGAETIRGNTVIMKCWNKWNVPTKFEKKRTKPGNSYYLVLSKSL